MVGSLHTYKKEIQVYFPLRHRLSAVFVGFARLCAQNSQHGGKTPLDDLNCVLTSIMSDDQRSFCLPGRCFLCQWCSSTWLKYLIRYLLLSTLSILARGIELEISLGRMRSHFPDPTVKQKRSTMVFSFFKPTNEKLLDRARFGGVKGVQKLVVKRGANVHHKNKCGWTATHFACFWGHLDMLVWLVSDAGANVNAQTSVKGETPLMKACQRSTKIHVRIVEWLIDHGGADVEIENYKEQTALDIATELGNVEVANAIRARTMVS